MGRLNRERVERIINGQEAAIRDGGGGDARRVGVSERVVCRIEDATRKIIEKTMVPKWTGMTLPQQVKVARGMLRVQGLASFRAGFLKENAFPDDIKDKGKAGWTNDQIVAYYLGCPEFRTFWGDLGLTEDNFKTLLPATATVAATPTTPATTEPEVPTSKRPWYRRMLFGLFSK